MEEHDTATVGKGPDRLWRQLQRAAAGVVLVAAVFLKLRAPSAETVGESLAVFAPQVRQAGLAAEAVVGLWLVSGYAARGAWLAGLVLFSTLAGASGYLAAVGQADCGCFGRMKVSPWVSLAVDAACLVLLLIGRPPTGRLGAWPTLSIYCGFVAGSAILLAGAQSRVGEAWLAHLRGDVVAVVPGVSDAGEAPVGSVGVVRVEVANRSGGNVRLIGGSVSCNCMATQGLPTTVPAFGRTEVEVKVKFLGSPGRFVHRFDFYTDLTDQPRISGRLAGTVVGPPP